MNEERQDMIDRYLRGEMNDREKAAFEKRLKADAGLKEQYDFTRTAVAALRSRREKLKRIEEWNKQFGFENVNYNQQTPSFGAHGKLLGSTAETKKTERRMTYRKVATVLSIAAMIAIAFFIFIPTVWNSQVAPPDEQLKGQPSLVIDDVMMEVYDMPVDSAVAPADTIPDPYDDLP